MDSKRRGPAEAKRFWELAIDLWSSSGLSVSDFCRREGLNESTFYGWKQRLRKQGSASDAIAAPMPAQAADEPSRHSSPRRAKRPHRPKAAGGLVPVRVVEDAEATTAPAANGSRPSPPIEIILPRGTRIQVAQGCDHVFLRGVLAVLEGLPC